MTTEVADMLDEARESLAKELRSLDELSDRARKKALDAPKYSIQLASHVAFLATKRAEIVSHLRQLEKHDRAQSKTPEQRRQLIKAAIRQMAPHELAEIADLVAELGQERRLLA